LGEGLTANEKNPSQQQKKERYTGIASRREREKVKKKTFVDSTGSGTELGRHQKGKDGKSPLEGKTTKEIEVNRYPRPKMCFAGRRESAWIPLREAQHLILRRQYTILMPKKREGVTGGRR